MKNTIKHNKKRIATLLIIADDFTGALDTCVQFTMHGASAKVMTSLQELYQNEYSYVDVLVIDAETRHAKPAMAYETVFSVVAWAVKNSIPYIYKKTDSALRGNVGAELSALLCASGKRRLPFLPAFPQMERYTKNGVHFIDGQPVGCSVFAEDPFEPVLTSDIAEIIYQQSSVEVHCCPVLDDSSIITEKEGIIVFDAESTADFEKTGKTLFDDGELHIMAGCAGFASILPALLGFEGTAPQLPVDIGAHFLVVCGSVNPKTRQQLAYAELYGFSRVNLNAQQKLKRDYWHCPQGFDDETVIIKNALQKGRCIIDTNDLSNNSLTTEWIAQNRLSAEEVRTAISESLGILFRDIEEKMPSGIVFVIGGDTLIQCMDAAGIRELEPVFEVELGIVLSKFRYKDGERYILSKSGGFGDRELLVRIADKLEKYHSEQRDERSTGRGQNNAAIQYENA